MNRSSKYYSLPFVVECKWPHNPFYEQIAAFDSGDIAVEYARTCMKDNSPLVYRVMSRKGNKWVWVQL